MKVACVYIDHFAVAVERREDESLSDKPLVVGGSPYERKPVYDLSPLAAEWGVKQGMTLRQAHELCPLAVFLPADEAKYQRAFSAILDGLENFSPYVEDASLEHFAKGLNASCRGGFQTRPHGGLAYLEISGMEGLHGNDETLAYKLAKAVQACFGVAPRVGLAGNKFAARIGALRSLPGEPAVIVGGEEREFLAPLPVSILPCSDKMKLRLHRFGIDTVGHFASLPANEVIFQFEDEGRLAHRLARGIDDRPVIPRPQPPTVVERVEYDYPVEGAEQILWSLEAPVQRAIGELEKSYRLCQEIRLHLTFDNGGAWYGKAGLHEPTAKHRGIVDTIRRLIGQAACRSTAYPDCEGMVHHAPTNLTLILANLCGEKGRQLNLFTDIKRWQALNRAVGELQRKLGQDCIKRPVIVDPLARLPERRFVYRVGTG